MIRQMEANNHGGQRRRAGRKTELPPTERTKPVTVTLDELTLRMLRALGGGNLSRGIREAARVAYARYQKT